MKILKRQRRSIGKEGEKELQKAVPFLCTFMFV